MLSITLAFLVVALLVACSAGAGSAAPTGPSAASRTVDPGISQWGQGQVEAAGYVTWIDLEGGFWVLNDRLSQSAADRPKVVAVLLPGSVSETSIAALEGAYVVASGSMQGGASIRMSGPEVMVDTIAVARPGAAR